MLSLLTDVQQGLISGPDAQDGFLDDVHDRIFSNITRLACSIFQLPISVISLKDGSRQWARSDDGFKRVSGRKQAVVDPAPDSWASPLIISDMLADQRFVPGFSFASTSKLRSYAGVPLFDREGVGIGSICAAGVSPRSFSEAELASLEDLAQIVMNEVELRRLSRFDSLTGALSRSAFRQELEQHTGLARRHGTPLSLIMLDIDHFKRVNDTVGHLTGDIVLRETVLACQSVLRSTDRVGRLGGEEFAIMLPHTPIASAELVAEKIRSAVSLQRHQSINGPFTVTASLGLASFEASVAGMDDLVGRADLALYGAKSGGRNRAQTWSPVQIDLSATLRRVFKAGRITFNAGNSTINCVVRKLSDLRAVVDVESTADIPSLFKLLIEVDRSSRLCKVIRKASSVLELEFVD